MIDFFLFIFIGVLVGSFAAIIPGIHTNLLCTIFLSSFSFNSFNFSILLISMSVTHAFVSILPSVFLGVPEENTVLSLLPAHKLFMKGIGFEAVKLYLLGGLFSLIFVIILSPILFVILSKFFYIVKDRIKFFLIIIILILILREKVVSKKILAFFVFLSSGLLGYLTIDLINEPLMILFSGFFAIPSLLFSFSSLFPKQYITDIIRLKPIDCCLSLFFVTFGSSLINLFPGLGISQSISLSKFLFSRVNNYTYLFMTGGINIIDFILSLITFYLFNKHRNGSIVALSSLIPNITINHLLLFFSIIFFVSGISVLLTLYFARLFIKIHDKINIKIINLVVLLFLLLLVFYFSGFIGLFVLILASLIGSISFLSGICRSHAMGCLLLVVLL